MVAIYPRQSIDKKDSLSIEQQIQRCVDLCKMNEWPYTIYGKDKGYSGKNLKRPSFEEMMADVRAGKINKILCYKFDRISRNISDFSNLMVELQNYNCEFISISENFDTTTPIGRAMVYICMVFAQMERENISQRVHDNYYYRTELGFWGGGVAPYGFKTVRTKYKGQMHTILEPNPETAEIVKMIYKWYSEPNGSVSKILYKLNEELHIPSQKGKKWTSRVIVDILTRALYAPNDMAVYNYLISQGANITNAPEEFDGKASIDVYGKKTTNASKHKRCREFKDMYCNISNNDSIIDSSTWIKVQNKRNQIANRPSRTGTGKNSYFTGLMKCSCCGTGVSYTNSRGTQGYYICSSRKNRGWNSCNMPPASKKRTDPAIIQAVIDYYSNPQVIKMIKEITPESQVENSKDDKKRNNLLMELAIVDKEIDNLISSLTDGSPILIKYINEKIEKLDQKRNEITQMISSLNAGKSTANEKYAIITQIRNMIDGIPDILESDDFDEIRDLCHLLINNILFHEDGSIDITYTV